MSVVAKGPSIFNELSNSVRCSQEQELVILIDTRLTDLSFRFP
jgi:hypothetical protein